ncbi:glycosyltransferase [Micromonospora sp. WMMD882]|uniref:glycosyltransferase n=1 Tax=Micromonospora sp. WMMD882 TaxID=3015151 RepID=UPI00248AF3EF|nr:glycosyltransferase [Micromonospora sp. WMMD882]WBB81587.1 glycosyltransferase [Micromonospora sp. WMMD882]
MRITVDATPIRPRHAAGVEVFTYGLLHGLDEATDHDVRVAVIRGTLDEWRRQAPGRRLRWTEHDVSLPMGNRYGQALRRWLPRQVQESVTVRRLLNAARRRAAVQPDDGGVTLFPCGLIPVRSGASVVVAHDLRQLLPEFRAPGFAAMLRENVARAAAVVVSWPHPYRQALAAFPEAADRIAMIPPPALQAAPDPSLADPEPGLLVYPSSTGLLKNHVTLLEALALLPECRLVCPGPLVEPEASRLLARAARPDLRGRVSFPGFVPLDELHRLYARADAVVVPSRWEAASGAMLEAFSWGLPVACSDAEPLLAQLEFTGGEAAVFEAQNPRSCADAIRRVLRDRDRYAEASRRANARLAGRTWADTARDYVALLEWVAAGRPGPMPRSAFAGTLTGGVR